MTKQVVFTENSPAPIGPYSQAIIANGFIFVAGQTAFLPETGAFSDNNVEGQTHQIFKNLQAILQAAGAGLENVVKTTVFLKDMNDFAAMNGAYGQYFASQPPARSTVEVARLPKDALVEIELVATIP